LDVHILVPHPRTPAAAVARVEAFIAVLDANEMAIEFTVSPDSALALPAPAPPGRADDLWLTTCFEIFVKAEGADSYLEFNFSPSGAWAAYRFGGYREGRQELPMAWEPNVETLASDGRFSLFAEFDSSAFPRGPARIALTAVIEETDGAKSYWALNHPLGEPDFHHPDCFALELPAPEQA
jgi:hypothetical protein